MPMSSTQPQWLDVRTGAKHKTILPTPETALLSAEQHGLFGRLILVDAPVCHSPWCEVWGSVPWHNLLPGSTKSKHME